MLSEFEILKKEFMKCFLDFVLINAILTTVISVCSKPSTRKTKLGEQYEY